jgi:hypothetical protein
MKSRGRLPCKWPARIAPPCSSSAGLTAARNGPITCEIGNGGKCHLVIRAGKSHKFTIPEEELPR